MSERAKILSVDDEELNQEIIIDLLEDEFDIKVLDNGQACLDSLANSIPDLILLDVNMPVLNGLETCKKLRSDERYKNILVIFVSALATSKYKEIGDAAGANDYLTKPFDEKNSGVLTPCNTPLIIWRLVIMILSYQKRGMMNYQSSLNHLIKWHIL